MTVAVSTSRSDYRGDGVQTAFPVGFQALTAADLAVYLTNPVVISYPTRLVLNVHYTVAGNLAAGAAAIHLVTPPASGIQVSILRDIAISQATNYEQYDDFPADSHERALDKLTMICQALQERFSRTVLYPVGATEKDVLDSVEFLNVCTSSRALAQSAAATAVTQASQASSAAVAAAASAAQAATTDIGLLEPRVTAVETALPGKIGVDLITAAWDFIVGSGPATAIKKTAAEVWAMFTMSLVGAYAKQQYAVPVVLATQSGAIALDADLHQDIDITATGAITLGAPANPVRGKTIFLTLYAASALAITWNAVFKPNADNALDATFAAGKRIFLNFRCVDGTNWLLMGRTREA